jgi:hypothetical protein
MEIFAEIIFTFIIVGGYIGVKKFFEKTGLGKKESTTSYSLNEDIVIDDVYLTDRQEIVLNFILENKSATEKEIINNCNTNKTMIKNLLEKDVIVSMNYSKLDKREIIILSSLLALLIGSAFLINYFILVRANFRFLSLFIYIGIFLFIGFNIVHMFMNFSSYLYKKILVIAGSGFVAFMLFFYVFGGRTIFHAEEYSNLINVDEVSFVEDINTVGVDTLPIVDKSYGAKLGSLKLGEYPGIGSEFQPGEYSDIIYQGKQYLVAALEYRGFFKWTSNNDAGTPGYILIDKVTSETKLINLRETTGDGLKYLPSAYFGQDLFRHAYYNGLSKYTLENYFFEIDEEGNPYYVLQFSLPSVFINGGPQIAKIAVVNALNGDLNIYSPDQVPSWVESVYPENLIVNQLNYWGSLQDGWLNSVFAQKGVVQTSNGTRVIMNEGQLYYFTGLISAGNDESTIGFIYANMRTKETMLFRFPGATEAAAMNKALTLIPQNNISTSFPIPLNVEGTPTYFILIKGEDGRILRYVYIKIQHLEFYTISETSKTDAYNRYLVKLNEDDDTVATNITGTINSITSYVVNGNTVYWIEIDDELYLVNVADFTDEEMRYFISKEVGNEISIYIVGFNVVSFELE